MEKHVEKRIVAIRDDREKGAGELAEDALLLLGEVAAMQPHKLKETAEKLQRCRSSMASIGNWARRFVAQEPGTGVADALIAEKRSFLPKQIRAARKVVNGTVFTLSYSSTIVAILSAIHCRVVVAESRPLYEGRRLVALLRNAGRDVLLVTDAGMAGAIEGCDVALIGADTICNDGSVVNKVGSLQAAFIAHHYGKPFHVAADSYKINRALAPTEIDPENRPGAEVWPEASHLCHNPTFEVIPPELITGYITERGLLTSGQL